MTTVSAVTQIEELSRRLDRAREIVGERHVAPVLGKDGQYVVHSGGLLGSQPVQAEVVENQQVGGQEGPEGAVHRVVHPGLGHGSEKSSSRGRSLRGTP